MDKTASISDEMAAADEISTARREMGLTQQALANLLDVAAVTVASWEIGRRIPRRRSVRDIRALLSQHRMLGPHRCHCYDAGFAAGRQDTNHG